MKKMINTLVAVSATIVIVGTVDAKNMDRRGTATSEVKQINDASKEVIVSPTQENITNIQDALATDDEEKLALQEAQAHELDLIGKIAIQKHIMSAMPRVPYIWDTRTQTEKDARKVADEKLKALENDMKQTKANIAKMTASVGAGYATSTKLAIATLVGLGVIAAGAATEYYLRPEGYMRTMLGDKQTVKSAFDDEYYQKRFEAEQARQKANKELSNRIYKMHQEAEERRYQEARIAKREANRAPTFNEIGQATSEYWRENIAAPRKETTLHTPNQLTAEEVYWKENRAVTRGIPLIPSQLKTEQIQANKAVAQIQANKAVAQARTEAAKERARQRTARQLQMRGQ